MDVSGRDHRWAQRMWEQREELSDLDADALDALCGLWLTQAQRSGDDAVADVDELPHCVACNPNVAVTGIWVAIALNSAKPCYAPCSTCRTSGCT